jgi:uncharacterized protein (DUF58 family)
MVGQLILRERAQETQRHVTLVVESTYVDSTPDEAWLARFERRIRDAASRAVAHLRRGDSVSVLTTTGDRVRADASVGADPVLRLLALLQPAPAPPRPEGFRVGQSPPGPRGIGEGVVRIGT